MDKKMIEQWALEAGIYAEVIADDQSEQYIADAINAAHLGRIAGFAARATAHEREQCALVCEKAKTRPPSGEPDDVERGFNGAIRVCAIAIRARGEVSQNG